MQINIARLVALLVFLLLASRSYGESSLEGPQAQQQQRQWKEEVSAFRKQMGFNYPLMAVCGKSRHHPNLPPVTFSNRGDNLKVMCANWEALIELPFRDMHWTDNLWSDIMDCAGCAYVVQEAGSGGGDGDGACATENDSPSSCL